MMIAKSARPVTGSCESKPCCQWGVWPEGIFRPNFHGSISRCISNKYIYASWLAAHLLARVKWRRQHGSVVQVGTT